MARRTKRSISPATKDRLLGRIKECRSATCQLSGEAPIYGPEYQAADQLRLALDDMTGVLTGNREHFWTQVHSTPKGMHVDCDASSKKDQTDKS